MLIQNILETGMKSNHMDNHGNLTQELFRRKTCYFYDTCSFRYHANMRWEVSDKIFEFIRQHDGMVVILRSILMELSSMEKTLNTEYVQYFQRMRIMDCLHM